MLEEKKVERDGKRECKGKGWMKLITNKKVSMVNEKIRKIKRDYPLGLRRLPTRMTPSRINAVVKVLLVAQKKVIHDMGFGSLLNLDMDVVPGLLN